MNTYLIVAKAEWVSGYEYPGGKRDCEELKSSEFTTKFDAVDLAAAEAEARRLLAEFKTTLPKQREGGLSWQKEDAKIVSVTFAQILDTDSWAV